MTRATPAATAAALAGTLGLAAPGWGISRAQAGSGRGVRAVPLFAGSYLAVLRRVERRADGDAGGPERNEHHLDGGDRRTRPRPDVGTTRKTRTGDKNDQPQNRDAGRMACRPPGPAAGGEGADAARRRAGAAAPGAALGRDRQRVSVRHRRGAGVARRPVPRTLAVARLSLHVRSRLHRGLSRLLGDRRR